MGFATNTTYFWSVNAANACGTSGFSSDFSFNAGYILKDAVLMSNAFYGESTKGTWTIRLLDTSADSFALADNGENLLLNIEEAGNYVFIFDSVDLANPMLRVFNQAFFGANTVFIRGTMNGWGEDNALAYDGNGAYSANITLDGSDVVFKVATGDWSTVNLGAETDETAAAFIGEDKVLVGGDNPSNLTIAAPAAGDYEFKVIGPDGNAPTLLITPIE